MQLVKRLQSWFSSPTDIPETKTLLEDKHTWIKGSQELNKLVPCSDTADFAHTPVYIRAASRNPDFLASDHVTFLKFLEQRWRLVDSVCLDSCLQHNEMSKNCDMISTSYSKVSNSSSITYLCTIETRSYDLYIFLILV